MRRRTRGRSGAAGELEDAASASATAVVDEAFSSGGVPEDRRQAFAADGFTVVDRLLKPETLGALHAAFDRLFAGDFRAGTAPDEVNWRLGTSDPRATRQICNGWKADPVIAATVLDEAFGRAITTLAGWPGARLIQDNVLWKPPGASAVGFHRDNSYLAWYRPQEMLTCWLALDDATEANGAVSFARGSHRWPHEGDPEPQFHHPADHLDTVRVAAAQHGVALEVAPVRVSAGGGSFHHGWTWHGSDVNRSQHHRRALVIHCASSDARFHRPGFGEGNGPIYSRYARRTDDHMDEQHFPILWHRSGRRSDWLPTAPG